jgi:hypothetical protein
MKDYLKISQLFHFMFRSHRGQISEKSDIGRWILCLSALSETNFIVEIGTWNGAGSSKLIAKGVSSNSKKSSSCEVLGLEIDMQKARSAKRKLKRFKFFKVLHGRIVEEADFDYAELTAGENVWIERDLTNLRNSSNVLSFLPNKIDLLILDGGEFSTYSEFQILQSRITKYVVLDDIFSRKCKKIFEEVKSSDQFKVIFLSTERNGTAVLLRK